MSVVKIEFALEYTFLIKKHHIYENNFLVLNGEILQRLNTYNACKYWQRRWLLKRFGFFLHKLQMIIYLSALWFLSCKLKLIFQLFKTLMNILLGSTKEHIVRVTTKEPVLGYDCFKLWRRANEGHPTRVLSFRINAYSPRFHLPASTASNTVEMKEVSFLSQSMGQRCDVTPWKD